MRRGNLCCLREYTYADRFDGIIGKRYRAIFKVLTRPDIISFAGGKRQATRCPTSLCADIAKEVLLSDGSASSSNGARRAIAVSGEPQGVYRGKLRFSRGEKKNLLRCPAPPGGWDRICKAFLNPGDTVLVESPTFLGNMQTLRLYQQTLVPIESDESRADHRRAGRSGEETPSKALYCIPTFQNPAAGTLSADRRKIIAEMARNTASSSWRTIHTATALRGGGPAVRQDFDKTGHVVYHGQLLQAHQPGWRGIWWRRKISSRSAPSASRAWTCTTPLLTQAKIDQFLAPQAFAAHLRSILGPYREKMHAMLAELETFPEGTQYTMAEGGLNSSARCRRE